MLVSGAMDWVWKKVAWRNQEWHDLLCTAAHNFFRGKGGGGAMGHGAMDTTNPEYYKNRVECWKTFTGDSLSETLDQHDWKGNWDAVQSRMTMTAAPSGSTESMMHLFDQKHSGLTDKIPSGLYTMMPLPETLGVDVMEMHTKLHKVFLEAAAAGVSSLNSKP